jgi:hypothetical protein
MVPARGTARTVARVKPAASAAVTAGEAVTLLKVRRPVGRPAKTVSAPAAALNTPAGKAEAANPLIAAKVRAPRQKARNQPAPGQEPVQWWVEGWNGGGRKRRVASGAPNVRAG